MAANEQIDGFRTALVRLPADSGLFHLILVLYEMDVFNCPGLFY